jgi:anti-anti-sigma factor
MPTSLTLDTARRNPRDHVLVAVGEIDLSNVDAFKEALANAAAGAADSGGTLTVDLSAVEYLDSAAINVLYARADGIANLIAQPVLMSSLKISGLAELVAVEAAPQTAEW